MADQRPPSLPLRDGGRYSATLSFLVRPRSHMIDWSWIVPPARALWMVPLTGVGIYLTLLLCTRLAGLRSFAKASSFDFAITVAMGSLLASTILSRDPPMLQGVIALVVLFGIQYLISSLRRSSAWMTKLVDNTPLLLMAGPEVIGANLDRARMTREDLHSKLRLAGVTHPEQVLAVVMETTGDVSVLQTKDDGRPLDPELFSGVRGAERLAG